MNLEVHPAAGNRFADVAAVLRPANTSPRACWCLTYRLSHSENSSLTGEARPQRLLALCEGEIAPGVVAYADGVAVGWCAASPRSHLVRLMRSRTIRKGVARALIDGAAQYACSHGAQYIEAYPVETDGQKISTSQAFAGTTALFQAAGFQFCAETQARSAGRARVIM